MDPTIVVLGIRALLRIAREGQDAYEQYQRDKPALFPSGLVAPATDVAFLRKIFSRHLAEIEDGGTYARFWKGTGPDPGVPGAAELLLMRAVQLDMEDNAAVGLGPTRRVEVGGAAMIQQWAEGRGPVGPVGRVVASLADVALEFVGARPSLLGVGGTGEALLGAMAGRLSALIPDDADAGGPRSRLAERAAGVFLRAGLDALSERTDALVDADDLRALVERTLVPLVAGLPPDVAGDLVAQSRWRSATDAVLGPAARLAVATLARNVGDVAADRAGMAAAVGALARAVVEQAGAPAPGSSLDTPGLLALYRAAVDLAEARPALFVARGDPPERVATELFRDIVEALVDAPPPFAGDGGAALGAAAVAALRAAGARPDAAAEAWPRAAGTMVASVVNGVRPVLDASPAVVRHALIPLADVVLRRAASTPGLIADGRTEVDAIMRAIATAIAADADGLLGPDDWQAVAGAIVDEAAANPGRWCPLSASPTETGPAAAIVVALLGVASRGRDAGGVLFGTTLREAVLVALRTPPGAAPAAAVAGLAARLNEIVGSDPARYGSREWLHGFRALLPGALRGAPPGALSVASLDELLAGRPLA